jgi:hypothetical protein
MFYRIATFLKIQPLHNMLYFIKKVDEFVLINFLRKKCL